ncbi:helix-turn-helix domain-containing protein [Micromonospora chalcea]
MGADGKRWSVRVTGEVRHWLRDLRDHDPASYESVRVAVDKLAEGLARQRARAKGGVVTEFYHWDEVRAELGGDDEAYEAERARTDAWVSAFHLAEERKRLGLTQRQVAEIMGVTPGRVSQIENGDLDVNEVATLSRYANALGARLRIIFDYGDDLRQIA